MKMRRRLPAALFLIVILVLSSWPSMQAADAISPGDIEEPAPGPRRGDFGLRFLLFFISLLFVGFAIFTIIEPRESFLLFRRWQYDGPVEISETFEQVLRFGSCGGLIIYSLLFILSGMTSILLWACGVIGAVYLLFRFADR